MYFIYSLFRHIYEIKYFYTLFHERSNILKRIICTDKNILVYVIITSWLIRTYFINFISLKRMMYFMVAPAAN